MHIVIVLILGTGLHGPSYGYEGTDFATLTKSTTTNKPTSESSQIRPSNVAGIPENSFFNPVNYLETPRKFESSVNLIKDATPFANNAIEQDDGNKLVIKSKDDNHPEGIEIDDILIILKEIYIFAVDIFDMAITNYANSIIDSMLTLIEEIILVNTANIVDNDETLIKNDSTFIKGDNINSIKDSDTKSVKYKPTNEGSVVSFENGVFKLIEKGNITKISKKISEQTIDYDKIPTVESGSIASNFSLSDVTQFEDRNITRHDIQMIEGDSVRPIDKRTITPIEEEEFKDERYKPVLDSSDMPFERLHTKIEDETFTPIEDRFEPKFSDETIFPVSKRIYRETENGWMLTLADDYTTQLPIEDKSRNMYLQRLKLAYKDYDVGLDNEIPYRYMHKPAPGVSYRYYGKLDPQQTLNFYNENMNRNDRFDFHLNQVPDKEALDLNSHQQILRFLRQGIGSADLWEMRRNIQDTKSAAKTPGINSDDVSILIATPTACPKNNPEPSTDKGAEEDEVGNGGRLVKRSITLLNE